MHDVLYSLETFNLDWCSAANEQSANLVAQAWGFKKELMALEHDRKLPEEILEILGLSLRIKFSPMFVVNHRLAPETWDDEH